MSRSRRPSISIYDYPEHLNPFSDNGTNAQPSINGESKPTGVKEGKHKFWTFGRNKKKRSNSFSIKSTWNGLFGKHKDAAPHESQRRTTITTVSSSYQHSNEDKPVARPRMSRDQREFDEALGTLARRRKYTLDSSSRYGSSQTVNGDSTQIYDRSPRDTTASIMGDLTPKPPARRFGQISPREKDKLPPLGYEGSAEGEQRQNGIGEERTDEVVAHETPVPPKRTGLRSSLRLPSPGGEQQKSTRLSLRDENENVPEDYIFRRFGQDAVRKSNLSINSCISVTSTASTIGRKKRRAPQPPQLRDHQESPSKDNVATSKNIEKVDLQTKEPTVNPESSEKTTRPTSVPEEAESAAKTDESVVESTTTDNAKSAESPAVDLESSEATNDSVEKEVEADDIVIKKTAKDDIEIIADVELRDKGRGSSGSLSRSDSFCVKEEIEKIEKQIKALEAKNASNDSDASEDSGARESRLSIQANRRTFFQDMVSSEPGSVRIEFKELPREQKNIHIVKLTDPPVPVDAPREPVKIIELQITEPIKRVAEIVGGADVNPIPKPRRNSALSVRADGTGSGEKESNASGMRGHSL